MGPKICIATAGKNDGPINDVLLFPEANCYDICQEENLSMNEGVKAPAVILVDVYETILNMSDIERKVNTLLNSKRGYVLWNELLLQYCFAEACMGKFRPFASLAAATMKMTASVLRENISDARVDEALSLLEHLPVHSGVEAGLSSLLDKGFRIAALTNAPATILRNRMERTGLISYFETLFNAEEVQQYKPCKEVYTYAAGKMGVSVDDCMLVSVHGWDIAGAANAGMRTAWVQQQHHPPYPLGPEPDLTCTGLSDLAERLAAGYK